MKTMLTYPPEVDEAAIINTERFYALVIHQSIAGGDLDDNELKEAFSLIPHLCFEARNELGNTPLILAARGENLKLVKELSRSGACLDAQNDDGISPLAAAIISNVATAVVDELLKSGVYLDARDGQGLTPLFRAIRRKKTRMIQMLLDKGANIYTQDQDGEAPVGSDLVRHFPIDQWQQQYGDFAASGTPPQSAEDVYHLLAVYPLIDPKAPVDREAHLRQIFSHAKWANRDLPGAIIKQLREDGSVSAACCESLLALVEPAKAPTLERHGRGR